MVIYTTEEKKEIRLLHPPEMSGPSIFQQCVDICLLCILARKPCQKGHRMLQRQQAWSQEGRQYFLTLVSNLRGRRASCLVMLNQLELTQQIPYPSLLKQKDIQIWLGKRSHDFGCDCAKYPLNLTLLDCGFLICSREL